uniref:Uncharacterized protein n=1 Tax=Populus trichocarpa TaxID=3694 RepID=A0A3N7FVR5_POPTR
MLRMSRPTKSHAFSIKKELMSSGPGALFPSHSHIAVLNSSIETGISKREDELRLNLLKLITEHEGVVPLSILVSSDEAKRNLSLALRRIRRACFLEEGVKQ